MQRVEKTDHVHFPVAEDDTPADAVRKPEHPGTFRWRSSGYGLMTRVDADGERRKRHAPQPVQPVGLGPEGMLRTLQALHAEQDLVLGSKHRQVRRSRARENFFPFFFFFFFGFCSKSRAEHSRNGRGRDR